MKKSLAALTTAFFLTVSGSALAHNQFELDAAVGYRFGGKSDVDIDDDTSGQLTLDSAPAFSVIGGYRFQSNGFVFVNYSRQSTTLRYRSDDLSTRESTGMSTEYMQFGGNLEVTRGSFTPYLGFSVGATRYAATDIGGDAWAFSAVLDGGAKFNITKWLHLRVLGRMPLTFLSGDSSLFCLSYAGCVATFSGTPVVQGEVYGGAGISF